MRGQDAYSDRASGHNARLWSAHRAVARRWADDRIAREIVARRARVRIPAGVVGQTWRDGSRQAVLARFLRSSQVEIRALDGQLARACGELCGATGTGDMIDASVVITARERRDTIISSDVVDLRRLDPTARIERI